MITRCSAFALFCLFKEPFPDNFGIYGINVCAMNNTHTHICIYIKWWVFDRWTGQLSWTHAAKQLMSIHENFCAFLENRSLIRQALELSVISPEWNDNWFDGGDVADEPFTEWRVFPNENCIQFGTKEKEFLYIVNDTNVCRLKIFKKYLVICNKKRFLTYFKTYFNTLFCVFNCYNTFVNVVKLLIFPKDVNRLDFNSRFSLKTRKLWNRCSATFHNVHVPTFEMS